jgi:DNA-binding transcriptional ArsR family regulator
METYPQIAAVGRLIGDATRAAMLAALLGGRALPASELARVARVSPQTASAHLAKLADAGLVAVTRIGRHRYYRLAGAEVARALEALAAVSAPPVVRSLRGAQSLDALRFARSCYDHLAGALAVALGDAFLEHGWLRPVGEALRLAAEGERILVDLGVDVPSLRRARRPLVRTCLDWSERRPHLAGAVGAALLERLLALGWLEAGPVPRALRLTTRGRAELERLGVAIPSD